MRSSVDHQIPNNMKTLSALRSITFAVLCTGLFVGAAQAAEPKCIRINQENLAKLNPADQARVLAIADRLETISALDRSALSRDERRALRSETRDLKREADTFNRGGTVIYISAGTLIIILLIILILT